MTRSKPLTSPDRMPAHRRPDRTIEDVRLTPWQRWSLLLVLATVFLVGGSQPVWHNPFDIDRAVWLSYAPIPVLVAACLLYSRRLSPLTWFLNTTEIVLLKFAFTYVVAIVLWAAMSPPAQPPADSGYRHDAQHRPAAVVPPPVTPWPEQARGRVRGIVRDASGAPLPGALVYVSSGLEEVVPPRPAEPAVLTLSPQHRPLHDNAMPLIIVQRYQPLLGRAPDGRMHALRFLRADQGEQGKQVLLSAPLLPDQLSPIHTRGLEGIMTVRCALHGESVHLAVMDQPHHTRSDASGYFELTRIPALDIQLSAWHPHHGTIATDLTIEPAGVADVVLEMP